MTQRGKYVEGNREGPGSSGGILSTAQSGRNYEGFQTQSVAVGEHPSIQKKEAPPRRLFESEWQACKAKGLYFKCDEKFTIGHQCKNRELRVLLVFNDGLEEGGEWEKDITQEETEMKVAGTIKFS